MPTEAKVICDSVSNEGHRLTTYKLRYPKFIHGELMTHRVFSRNASSSRAVPTAKLLAEVESPELRACPSFSVVNAPGMQGGRPTTDAERLALIVEWGCAATEAAARARRMFELGGAKQDVNRLLEPYTHINVLVTATEYMNFFGLRLDAAAQPEMRMLAEAMWRAYGESEPVLAQPDQWHLPFIGEEDLPGLRDHLASHLGPFVGKPFNGETRIGLSDALKEYDVIGKLVKVSTARCARVSYESFETGRRSTVEEDLRLYAKLFPPGQAVHASPAEHQATPDTGVYKGMQGAWDGDNRTQWGNFTGWRQHRKMLPGESMAPLPKEYRQQQGV